MSNPPVQTDNLTRKSGDHIAVAQLSLTVAQGEIFGFLGHNGAGKTTTIRLLTTLILPTSGSARICGFDIVKDNLAVRQRIGYVRENVRLYNDLTVAENLHFFAALSGIKDLNARVVEVLAMLGHAEWHSSRLGGFAKGVTAHE